jgi:rhodanese-related sulfurtransferase
MNTMWKKKQLLGAGALVLLMSGHFASAPALAGEPAAAQPATGPAATTPVPAMSQDALLQHQALHAEHLFVLDVRTPEEFAEGHVPGAVNISHEQLGSRLDEVPKDKDVVLYCRSGRRAAMAADVLRANGYSRLSHLEGDMLAWAANGRPIARP